MGKRPEKEKDRRDHPSANMAMVKVYGQDGELKFDGMEKFRKLDKDKKLKLRRAPKSLRRNREGV